MRYRRNDHDVTNSVKTTDPDLVSKEVCRIYEDLYQRPGAQALARPFDDFAKLYRGENPDYHPCDTTYHDVQHVLDVTLAMARLLDGYERGERAEALGERLFRFGVVLALFHDCGYIRHRKDTRHRRGAEYTLWHVSRGAQFLQSYMPRIGMADLALAAARTVHFTGYEIAVQRIRVPSPIFRAIGNLLGTADILAQMADRCYLEKCHERLFPEFLLGGIARRITPDGKEQVVFASAADLISKTPDFYTGAAKRLDTDLAGAHRYVRNHFGGDNLYFDELGKNIAYSRLVATEGDMSRLRRQMPSTIADPESAASPPRLDKTRVRLPTRQ